jgi:hypothetical protein
MCLIDDCLLIFNLSVSLFAMNLDSFIEIYFKNYRRKVLAPL